MTLSVLFPVPYVIRSLTYGLIGAIKCETADIGCDHMATSIKKRKKARILRENCVACGACINVCPVSAISICKGIWADVDPEKCIGCTKCEKICPPSAITMEVLE